MQPKNTTATSVAQEQKLRSYESALANTSQDMQEAGQFVWALGTAIHKICEEDLTDEVLNGAVLSGLAQGLRIVGAKLQDDGTAHQSLLRGNGAFAEGGAQ
ncbi:hypothetical protein [Pseudomonas syringae group genomosp. 3]|uniref:hypothetical protein n=1 Tax=Pseudomonas syringae group genomosp. 3 TaxID=251701 RepID=UPI0006B92C07|nr:hypothetical protein [Pseudomonas syringae group genomosp. 3]